MFSSTPSSNSSAPPAQIDQTTNGDRNQIIGQAVSSTIFNVTGGQITIYPSQLDRASPISSQPSTSKIGPNPYRGLLAFQETDGDYFFGREQEVKILWEKLSLLHEEPERISILPILGPSGSGKSSLAQAGLIPELARRPLPGRERARVAILVPGAHPLEALAAVLARVATDDPTPVTKTREFATELAQANAVGTYDGLRRIVNVLPETHVSPLILLVDQFEEIYTLCKDPMQRECFVENLLEAAAEQAQQVLLIITLRSDFLSEIQKHPKLNPLFSEEGFLVPAMDEAKLRQIIAKPAELAGHPLDEAMIRLLIEDTLGREGALPLLQSALSCIWEGLARGVAPTQTLEQIGGVGGALAGEAQVVYDSLSPAEQTIVRRLFLGLVQLGEGTRDTRRRVAVDYLISHQDDPEQVNHLVDRFAQPGLRLLTCSTSNGVETVEITHEALLDHWQLLNQWLEQSRNDLRFQRRLEEDAQYWKQHGCLAGSLWQPPELDLLKQYQQRCSANLTRLQMEFLIASQQAEEIRRQEEIQEHRKERQQRLQQWMLCSLMLSFFSAIGFACYQQRQAEVQRVRQLTDFAEALLATQPLNAEANGIAQINAIAAVNLCQSALIRLTQDSIVNSANQALLHTIQVTEGRKLLVNNTLLSDSIVAIAFNPDGKTIVTGGIDKVVRLWNANTQQPLGKALEGHQKAVISVAFSPDGKRIVSGSVDRTIRLWDASTREQIRILKRDKERIGHKYSVVSVAFSPDGKRIVSGSDDKTIRIWDASTGDQLMQMQGSPFQPALVGYSSDGKTVFSRSYDNTMRFWDANTGELKSKPEENGFQTDLNAFSSSGKTIVSGNYKNTTHLENLLQTACAQLDNYSNLLKNETEVTQEVKQACNREVWSKPQP